MDSQVFISSSLIPQADWILVSMIPTEVVFADASRLLTRIVVISLALLAVAAVISILLAGVIVKPAALSCGLCVCHSEGGFFRSGTGVRYP
jgi:hypothetical protein